MAKPASDAYRNALEQARAREHALRLASLRRLDQALNDYITVLTLELAQLPKSADMNGRRMALQHAIKIASQQQVALVTRMEQAVGDSRRLAYQDILDLNNQASLEIAKIEGVPTHLLGAVQKPQLSLAGAWESLGTGAATWRTLLRGYVKGAVNDAQNIMTFSLLEGVSPDELARRLRPYLQGSEPFQKAFGGMGEITDKMLRDPKFSGAAKVLRYNADRIVMSEIHNARGEAELQAFAASPFVEAVRWQLSPNRGKLRGRDACDGLAQTDFFGLGKGVYPCAQVPAYPHPFCRCERVPIPRAVDKITEAKPNPKRLKSVKVQGTGCQHG